MEIADEQHVVTSTGAGTSRARVVRLSDGRLGLLVADDLVADGQPISVRAERSNLPELHGTAQLVRSGRAFDETRARLRKKYGFRVRLSHVDTIVVVHPDAPA